MFGRRDGYQSPRRFWSWFAAEAQGVANAMEALARGEADADWAFVGLNERIRRTDPRLEADVVRTPEGKCRMIVSGASASTVLAVLEAAPRLAGWIFSARDDAPQPGRMPFRSNPRPSLDTLSDTQLAPVDHCAAEALAH